MPFISLEQSPLAPSAGEVRVFYREFGSGRPLIFLHGGWGYEIYPFDRQVETFSDRFRIVIPDRTGYGRSERISSLPIDFHRRAAIETLSLMDGLELERPVLWGHSDGAVISALMALAAPERVTALILEAFHFIGNKPASREFFENMMLAPERLGDRVCGVLARDHGEDRWQEVIRMNGIAWLDIAQQSAAGEADLYDGKLSRLTLPILFVHGARDPRTEPGEMEAVRQQLPHASIHLIPDGAHSPHSERAAFAECNDAADRFLASIGN